MKTNRRKSVPLMQGVHRILQRSAKKLNCKMAYISTDYVFDGQGTEPWEPDCKDYTASERIWTDKTGGRAGC